MSDPEFLELEDVLAIHREQLARFGGGAGIRDAGLLDSALATPRATFGGSYVHGDVFSMAAAYAFHVAENQPFVDGNKRTGLLCAVVFLEIGSDREKPLVLTRGKRDLSTAPKLGGCALGGLLSLSTPRARDDRRPAVCRDRFQSRAHGREERRQEGYEEAEHRAGEDPDPGRDRQRFHWEFSLDDKITHASDGALRIYGLARDKFHLAEAQALVLAECRPVLDTASSDLIEKGAKYDIEFKIRRASDGKVVDIHSRAEYDPRDRKVFGIIQDVTSRKAADAERDALRTKLALASRLAAMGTLVAGVAHEINNPLTGVMAGVGTAMLDVQSNLKKLERGERLSPETWIERDREILEMLGEASEAAARIKSIVRDLSVFGAPTQDRARLRASDIVAGAMRWLPSSVHTRATVSVEDLGAPDVKASRGQLEQVLVNLLTNAAKATRPGAKGTILIRLGAGSPGMARLEVVDHGTGIDPVSLSKIFDPFFTTRPPGERRGTGLGLSICHAIITDHGGTITVETEVGKGSTFRVELPAAPVEPVAAPS